VLLQYQRFFGGGSLILKVGLSGYTCSQSLRLFVFGITVCWALVGCGKSKQPWEVVHPVSGTVNYQGKPLSDARITLIPKDPEIPSSVRPTATSGEDGTFIVGTYSTDDGAPAGEYKVIVVRFPVIVTASNATSGPNNLPPKYSNASTTDLSVTVEAGANELSPLELN
jgi:hypothetical protein